MIYTARFFLLTKLIPKNKFMWAQGRLLYSNKTSKWIFVVLYIVLLLVSIEGFFMHYCNK